MSGGLPAVLGRAQAHGLLGPGPVEEQLQHAQQLAELIGPAPSSFLDLGSGAGLPGLVLALTWPAATGVLLDAGRRRGEHLRAACAELGLIDRITVVVARAEESAHQTEWRGRFPLVVARGFGPPAVTAECAVGFLGPGGELVVSEPPGGAPGRWDTEGLARLGLGEPEVRAGGGASIARVKQLRPPGAEWPRRNGVPARRPLWR
jgi:16S rRNA (guanine527-N7)-methyltransferase